MCPGSEKWIPKSFGCEHDASMCGLGGAKKWKCWKAIGFCMFLLKVKGATGILEPGSDGASRGVSTSKKCDFWLKMLYAAISNCASCAGGEHIFRKIMKKWCQHVKDAVKIMSDTSKCHQHSVAYMKMSSKWCRIHGSSRPRKPPVQIIHVFARIVEVQLGGHGGDKRVKERTAER